MKIIHDTLTIPNDPTPWLLALPNEKKEYCVLWLQGWTSTIKKHESLIERLATSTGIPFAILDYAGHGTHPISLDKTTREQQFNEVLAAYDELKSRGYKRIIVAGTSFGGYMAALLTAKRDPYAIILRAPAIYRDEEFSTLQSKLTNLKDANYAFRETVTEESKLTAVNAVRNFSGTTYVVEHKIDSVIPPCVPYAYFAVAKRGNYLIVPNTDHSLSQSSNPEMHYRYIERLLANAIELIYLEYTLDE